MKFTYETPQNIDDDDDEAVPEKTSTILCSLTPGKVFSWFNGINFPLDRQLYFGRLNKLRLTLFSAKMMRSNSKLSGRSA